MNYLSEIALGIVVPTIIGLIKIYGDVRVLRADHKSMQSEINEFKINIKDSDDKLDRRFDKLENLIEKLYIHERNNFGS